MPKIIFRPNPTPPPFVPPTPTPTIIYPVDIDAYSKIQFGEFIDDDISYDAVVDAVGDFWIDDYSYQKIYYTNDGVNFTQVNISSNTNHEDKVYLQFPNVDIVSQAIGWYLEIYNHADYKIYYMAVTLN